MVDDRSARDNHKSTVSHIHIYTFYKDFIDTVRTKHHYIRLYQGVNLLSSTLHARLPRACHSKSRMPAMFNTMCSLIVLYRCRNLHCRFAAHITGVAMLIVGTKIPACESNACQGHGGIAGMLHVSLNTCTLGMWCC